jgi:hypothetical protein
MGTILVPLFPHYRPAAHLFQAAYPEGIRTNSHLCGDPRPRRPLGPAFSRLARRPLDARKAKLIDVLENAGTKTLRYLYHHGDRWEHTIKVERTAPLE